MNHFHLYERDDGRVVLTPTVDPKLVAIRVIKAKTWLEAYATIGEDEFFRDHGYGCFITPRDGAYQRAREHAQRVIDEKAHVERTIASLTDSMSRHALARLRKTA